MATTAPGSPYVESSDLVANYPAVSEALAERVDTVGVLPFASSTARGTAIPSPTEGQYTYLQDTNATEYWDGSAWVAAGVAPGLVHINTATFSASSAVNINDVFSATYENYLMLIKFTASTASGLSIRMRVGGADNTATSYQRQRVIANGSTIGGANSTDTSAVITNYGTALNNVASNIFNPFEAEITGIFTDAKSSEGTTILNLSAVTHNVGSSFTGISLIPLGGNITGTARIYGYKNS